MSSNKIPQLTVTMPSQTLSVTINNKLLHVIPLTFNRARLCIGPTDSGFYDDVW